MKKACAICGRKLGFLTAYGVSSDGYIICSNELKDFAPSLQISDTKIDKGVAQWVNQHTLQEFIDAFNGGQTLVDADAPKVNVPLSEIQAQMEQANVSDLFGTSKEVKYLPTILEEGEVIQYATSGSINGNTALMLCTNLRVLIIDRGMIYGTRSTEVPLDMVNGVSYSQGLVLGKIDIVNGSQHVLVENVDKKTAPIMVNIIKKVAQAYKQNLYQPSSASQPSVDPAEEIMKFKKLLDAGAITKEEYQAKKKQLLNL